MHTNPKYPECEHLTLTLEGQKSPQPLANSDVSKEADPSTGYNILPLMWEAQSTLAGIRRCSLRRDAALACRWAQYKEDQAAMTARRAFRFPEPRDFHFINHQVVYDPSRTPARQLSYRRKMRVGPGIDNLHELPIPNDTSLRPKPPKSSVQKAPKVRRHFEIQNAKEII